MSVSDIAAEAAADLPEPARALQRRIEDRTATVGVIGLGYVGLPLALAFAEGGFRVLGFDVDDSKVERLNRGESYIAHFDAERIAREVGAGRLLATVDFSRLAEADAVLVCVPTPLTAHREPDMSYVEATSDQIRNALRPGQLVVLESTTYPGTTDELVRERLEDSGLASGVDFWLAFSPEREDPGNPRWSTSTIPKVVGGVDPVAGDLAAALYEAVLEAPVVRVSSARVAEAAKLTENVFRAVNIALVNELKTIYDAMGIDVWEVLDAAATKPFGFMRFDPGPGWGGHCIPIDPFYLSWKAREFGKSARFIELAGEINLAMPEYVIERVAEALNADGKPVKGSRVLIVGLAYKPDVADDRESPSYHLMDGLARRGAEVAYHDPHVPVIRPSRDHSHWARLESVEWTEEVIRGFDVVVVSTAHRAVDHAALGRWARCVVDTRNAMAGVDAPDGRVWKA
ncbi:MAG TPA: nucleotide sugar dehydrogenase [Gemmatimonadota bacterium]|nr:nucleotide sugar dehydrogenase [Gemmatimonadota bacterium]